MMTETEFVERVRQHVRRMEPQMRALSLCTGSTTEQTVAKVEAVAFISVMTTLLEKVGRPI
jgi:hypothetical protein